jgi:hypothetical protein
MPEKPFTKYIGAPVPVIGAAPVTPSPYKILQRLSVLCTCKMSHSPEKNSDFS